MRREIIFVLILTIFLGSCRLQMNLNGTPTTQEYFNETEEDGDTINETSQPSKTDSSFETPRIENTPNPPLSDILPASIGRAVLSSNDSMRFYDFRTGTLGTIYQDTDSVSVFWSNSGDKYVLTRPPSYSPILVIHDTGIESGLFDLVDDFPFSEGTETDGYSWSADDIEIAFAARALNSEIGSNDIYAINLKDNSIRTLIEHPADDLHPLWSPDGKKIAFVSNRTGVYQLFVLSLETNEISQLTNFEQSRWLHILFPQWSPDSSMIAFRQYLQEYIAELFVTDLHSEEVSQLTFSGEEYIVAGSLDFDWSPDSHNLVFSGVPDMASQSEIYSVNVKSKMVRRLTDSEVSEISPVLLTNSLVLFISYKEQEDSDFTLSYLDLSSNSSLEVISSFQFSVWQIELLP